MPFRLNTDEPVRRGLRRVLRKQLDAAVQELSGGRPTDQALHNARKHIKKARAVIRLVERSMDIGDARVTLRHAGRLLAPLRDASAIRHNAEALCAKDRRAVSHKTCLALRALLKERKARAHASAERHRVVELATDALRQVRACVDDWKWRAMGAKAFVRATERVYKRARRAMADAKNSDDAALFHEWRKRVKLLWYAFRLQEGLTPAVRREVAQLERLQDWLGDDHNLMVLTTTIRKDPPLSRRALRVRQMAQRRQTQLRRLALKRGTTLFAARPRAFREALRALRPAAPPRRRGAASGYASESPSPRTDADSATMPAA